MNLEVFKSFVPKKGIKKSSTKEHFYLFYHQMKELYFVIFDLKVKTNVVVIVVLMNST